MSWCKVREIGAGDDVTIDNVKAVAQIFHELGLIFYEPNVTFFVDKPAYLQTGENTWMVDAGRQIVDLTSVKIVDQDWSETDAQPTGLDERVFTIVSEYALPLRITANLGVVSKLDLVAGDTISAGETIIRSDEVKLIEADETAQDGDVLLEPPYLLTLCAISIARRLYDLTLDDDAKWDDGMNTLIDGWKHILEKYT